MAGFTRKFLLPVLTLLLTVIISAACGLLYYVLTAGLTLDDLRGLTDYLFLASSVPGMIAAILSIPLLSVSILKAGPGSMGIVKPSVKGLGVFALTGFALPVTGYVAVLISGSYSSITVGTDISILIDGILYYLLIAMYEELLIRGFIQSRLKAMFNANAAIIVSSLLFLSLHIFNPNLSTLLLINIFLAGILFGAVFEYTGSIWNCAAFHLMWNFTTGTLLGFNVSGLETESIIVTWFSGSELITGGASGFEGSLVCTVLLAIFIYLLYIKYGKKNKQQ